MILEELVALLGFRVEGEQELSRFERNLSTVGRRIGTAAQDIARFGAVAAGAFAAAGAGILKLVSDAAGPLDELGKIADRAGVGFEDLQRLGFAAEQSGSSVQEMGAAVESVAARLAEAARGSGRAKAALDAYGISATDANGRVKDAAEFFGELADHMQTMSEAESLDLAQKLGISRGLLTMLREGREAIELQGAIAEEAGLIFGDDARRAATDFNDTLNLFRRSLDAIKTSIAIALLPALTETIEGMQQWLNVNREFISQNIAEIMSNIAENIRFIGSGLADMDIKTIALIGVAFALAMPKIAKFSAILFAVNDILTHWSGGESVFGGIVQWLQEVLPISEGVAEGIAGIGAALATVAIFNPVWSFKALRSGIKGLAGVIGPALAGAVFGMSSAIGKALKSAFVAAVGLAGLLTPVGWGIILAGAAAALVWFFWDDLKEEWDAIDWAALGVAIGEGIHAGLEFMKPAIQALITELIPPWLSDLLIGGITDMRSSGALGAINRDLEHGGPVLTPQSLGVLRGGDVNQTFNIGVEQHITGSSSAPADQSEAARRAWSDFEGAVGGFGTTAPSPVQ